MRRFRASTPTAALRWALAALGMALAPGAYAQEAPARGLRIEVGGAVQYTSGGLTLFSVRVDRWSPGAIDLTCAVAGRTMQQRVTLDRPQRTGEHDGAGAWRHVSGVPFFAPLDTPLADLPRGRQTVRCRALAVGDEDRATHEATLDFPAVEGMLPDIRPRATAWFEATACDHGAVPVATQPLCVAVLYEGHAGYGTPAARCTLDGVPMTSGAPPQRHNTLHVRLDRVTAGPHRLACTLSLTGPGGYEARRDDNTAQATLTVRGREADWRYDLALAGIDAASHRASVPGEYRGQSTPPMPVAGLGLGVRVRNAGRDRVERLEVVCQSGAAVLRGESGPLAPGETASVEVTTRAVPPGVAEVVCRATTLQPRAVPDRTPDDNTRRARVRFEAVAP